MSDAPSFTIRPFRPGDEADCVDIYVDAVRNGTAPHYTPEEASAWAPDDLDPAEWTGRLSAGATWIAETAAGASGFITLTRDGHLDLFFVRPAARPLGVAPALYDRLIRSARAAGLARLTTNASHLARRFLERRGWIVSEEQRVLRNGIILTRFLMRLEEISS